MSLEPNTCSQGGVSVLRTLELNEEQLLELHTLTGRYVYKIEGLKYDDSIMPSTADPNMPEVIVDTPCIRKSRSRWMKKDLGELDCVNNLHEDTFTALQTAIRITNDPNVYFKDGM